MIAGNYLDFIILFYHSSQSHLLSSFWGAS